MSARLWQDRTLTVLVLLLSTCFVLTITVFAFFPYLTNHHEVIVPPDAVTQQPGTCLSSTLVNPARAGEPVRIKILAVNDFHGQLPPGQTLNKRPVGGAPVLASYLRTAIEESGTGRTILALPGDVVGASPPESGLLLDEPSMVFFNMFANPCCGQATHSPDPRCNMVSTIGNHEFDKGTRELMRLIYGGNGATTITHLVDPYPQSRSTYVCSNVVWKANGTPILPPYTIRTVDDAKVAFIGADTITTPERQKYVNIENVKFLDEAGSINRYVTEVQQKGVHAIVVLLHEGGSQVAYDGRTRPVSNVTGRIVNIVSRLDGDVDIVLSGHTHQFSNAYLTNAGGKPVLVTQAYMFSKGYADVDIAIDRVSGDIVEKSARVVLAYADQPPGTTPDPEVSLFLAEDEKVIAPVTAQVIGVAARDITRNQNSAGESALGDLVADSQRAAMETDIAFITTGALRADIQKGNVTWSTLYTADPFSDTVVSVTLTGQQVREALERQWKEPLPPHNLGISGLSYTWDAAKPAGGRVVNVTVHGDPLDEMKEYSAAMVTYLVTGGDGYRVFTEGTGMMVGRADIDALNFYFGSLPQPVNVTIDGRIRRIN